MATGSTSQRGGESGWLNIQLTTEAPPQSPAGVVYEITPTPSGPVLFDFMGPADVIDLLQSVEVHLSRAGQGVPL